MDDSDFVFSLNKNMKMALKIGCEGNTPVGNHPDAPNGCAGASFFALTDFNTFCIAIDDCVAFGSNCHASMGDCEDAPFTPWDGYLKDGSSSSSGDEYFFSDSSSNSSKRCLFVECGCVWPDTCDSADCGLIPGHVIDCDICKCVPDPNYSSVSSGGGVSSSSSVVVIDGGGVSSVSSGGSDSSSSSEDPCFGLPVAKPSCMYIEGVSWCNRLFESYENGCPKSYRCGILFEDQCLEYSPPSGASFAASLSGVLGSNPEFPEYYYGEDSVNGWAATSAEPIQFIYPSLDSSGLPLSANVLIGGVPVATIVFPPSYEGATFAVVYNGVIRYGTISDSETNVSL